MLLNPGLLNYCTSWTGAFVGCVLQQPIHHFDGRHSRTVNAKVKSSCITCTATAAPLFDLYLCWLKMPFRETWNIYEQQKQNKSKISFTCWRFLDLTWCPLTGSIINDFDNMRKENETSYNKNQRHQSFCLRSCERPNNFTKSTFLQLQIFNCFCFNPHSVSSQVRRQSEIREGCWLGHIKFQKGNSWLHNLQESFNLICTFCGPGP